MKTLAETSLILKQLIKNIDFITNPNYFCFDSGSVIYDKLNNLLNELSIISILSLENEIWEEYSYPERYEKCENLISRSFSIVIAWNENIDNIPVLKNILRNDIENFFNRLTEINRTQNIQAKMMVGRIYDEIGLRLYKVQKDIQILKENLKNRTKEEEEEISILTTNAPNDFFYLNEDKKNAFLNDLIRMFNEQYFITSHEEIEIQEPHILLVFQEFLETDLLSYYNMNWEELMVDENIQPKLPLNLDTDSKTQASLFTSLLLHEQKEILAQKLKEVFPTETGKSIRLLLHALETYNPPLITVGNRKLKQTYNAMSAFFNRNIGSYQSLSSYKYDETKDKPDFESIQQKLSHCMSFINP